MSVRIAVDAMGGDNAPSEIVSGAVHAARENRELEIILVGRETAVMLELSKHITMGLNISIEPADQVIGMDESPAVACHKKKKSSIMVCAEVVKRGRADAMVSAGNTGAAMTATLLSLGRLKNVIRPAIAGLFPTAHGRLVFLDLGANVDCKPVHLFQFAVMGGVFARHMLRIDRPRIALLGNGEEETKGNDLVLETHALLKNSGLNFVGNVEGRDVVGEKADVIVCDGMVGNVVLKFAEGLMEYFYKGLVREFSTRSIFRNFGAVLAKPVVKDFLKRTDYSEYGGAPLLGSNGVCIISHGLATAKAMKNAIGTAADFVKFDINRRIEEELLRFGEDRWKIEASA